MTWNARKIAIEAGLTDVRCERDDYHDTMVLFYGWKTFRHGVAGQPDVRGRAGSIVIKRGSQEQWFREQVAEAVMNPGATDHK